jgi:hypothetical protein
MAAALPSYADDHLSALPIPELLDWLARDEDRVPRNLIDECVRRGDAMISALGDLLDRGDAWEPGRGDGRWWRALHTAMILGLMPGEAAGALLVRCMRRFSDESDDNLQDWLAEHWPVFFANKPASLMSDLYALASDRGCDAYIRVCANETLVDRARRDNPAALDERLARLAAAAADETEDWDYRLLTANLLLDFPRPQHRPLLEKLARLQEYPMTVFGIEDVEQAYGTPPDLSRRKEPRRNPWDFYEPAAIRERQERWAREDREARERQARGESDDEEVDFAEPYVRDLPKIGRNDPCPCGSGKKFKKCCLDKS